MLLKPSMVMPGKDQPPASPVDVAERTVRMLRRTVPPAVPGIFFLSGGQSPTEATVNLNAMNRLGPHAWPLSFSYGRALQKPVLEAWKGQSLNVERAENALLKRARLNSAACQGRYDVTMETAG